MERTSAAYARIHEAVGVHADEIGPRDIASHWPFIGSQYRGLVIVG
jgi:hypothetical protein